MPKKQSKKLFWSSFIPPDFNKLSNPVGKAIELLNWSFKNDILTADEYDEELDSLLEDTVAAHD